MEIQAEITSNRLTEFLHTPHASPGTPLVSVSPIVAVSQTRGRCAQGIKDTAWRLPNNGSLLSPSHRQCSAQHLCVLTEPFLSAIYPPARRRCDGLVPLGQLLVTGHGTVFWNPLAVGVVWGAPGNRGRPLAKHFQNPTRIPAWGPSPRAGQSQFKLHTTQRKVLPPHTHTKREGQFCQIHKGARPLWAPAFIQPPRLSLVFFPRLLH